MRSKAARCGGGLLFPRVRRFGNKMAIDAGCVVAGSFPALALSIARRLRSICEHRMHPAVVEGLGKEARF